MVSTDVSTGNSSESWFEKARLYIPGGVNSGARAVTPPIVWRNAQGSKVYDVAGKEYLDYHCAFGPIVLGHNFPAVNQQVAKARQSGDLMGVGTTESEIRLAAKLCEHVPSAERALLCISGTKATFNAVRLARAATGRKKLIKFQGCFHGRHDYLCMNVISPAEKLGHHDPCSAGIPDEVVQQTIVVKFNSVEEAEDTLRREKDQIAAIIPVALKRNHLTASHSAEDVARTLNAAEDVFRSMPKD